MKTVFLVRHGESTDNAQSTAMYQDGLSELSELGKDQARRIAERARKLPADIIISSPYLRARQTADAISEATGVLVLECEHFIEHRSPVSFAGRAWSEELNSEFDRWQAATYKTGERYLDGENFDDMRARAERALSYLESREESDIFVVTHGMFSRVLVGLVMLQDAFVVEDLKRMNHTLITRNTGITVIRHGVDDDRKTGDFWHMLTWNDHAHLG